MEDRKAQFDLSLKLYAQLGEMTYLVDRMNAARKGLDERAAKLGDDGLAKKCRKESERVDAMRKKIVATKEGGMITGEERLREYLASLYGDVSGYEGRPSQTQVERTDAPSRKNSRGCGKEFDAWSTKSSWISTKNSRRKPSSRLQ
jgi:hypothetical protein